MEQYPEAGRPEGGWKLKYAVVYERTGTGYSAYVPDLPGCVATARTRADVERRVRDAIKLHIDGLRQSGEHVPTPVTDVALVEMP